MGTYRAPAPAVDTTFNQLNKIVGESINKFDLLFAEKKKEQKIQMEKNAKIKEKNDLDRANSYANWNKELRRVTPATGFSDENTQQLERWSEEYYSLSGKTDLYSLRRMAQLMSLPGQIANGTGAMTAINKRYTAGKNITGTGAKTIDYNNSDAVNLDFMAAYNDVNTRGNIHTREVGGKIYYELGDQTLDNSAFVEGALEGGNFILYNGSMATAMDPIIKAKQEEIDYKGQSITDDRSGKTKTIGTSYTEDNERYDNAMHGQNYEDIMKDDPYMKSIFTEQIDLLTKEAQKDPKGEAARLLYGDDLKKGEGGDDYTDLLQANNINGVGPWVGSNPDFGDIALRQQEIAKEGFYLYSQKEEFKKPDYVETGIVYKNQTPAKVNPPASDYTPAVDRKINSQRNRDLYQDNQSTSNRIAMAAKSKKPGRGVGKASELLVKELNLINQSPVFKDNIREGTYAISDGSGKIEKGKVVFLPKEHPDEPELVNVDLTNPNDVNEILTIEGSGMTPEVYDAIGSRFRYNEYEYEWVKTSKGPRFVKKNIQII